MKRTVWQKILWALGYERGRVDLVAPHSCAECVGRLRQLTRASVWTIFSSRPVSGYVGETGFVLRKTRFLDNPNSGFHTVVRGVIAEEGRQTRLRCRLGIPRLTFFVMAIWFSALLLVGGKTLAASVIAAMRGASSLNLLQDGILGPLIGIGCGVLTVGIGRYLARDDQRFLVNFLIATLDAHEVPPSSEIPVDFWTTVARWIDP